MKKYKISNADMVDVLRGFLKQMLIEAYDMEDIGKMCALLIHANDLLADYRDDQI